jgi:hypothetical protein
MADSAAASVGAGKGAAGATAPAATAPAAPRDFPVPAPRDGADSALFEGLVHLDKDQFKRVARYL